MDGPYIVHEYSGYHYMSDGSVITLIDYDSYPQWPLTQRAVRSAVREHRRLLLERFLTVAVLGCALRAAVHWATGK